jgi:hypothetical protein
MNKAGQQLEREAVHPQQRCLGDATLGACEQSERRRCSVT